MLMALKIWRDYCKFQCVFFTIAFVLAPLTSIGFHWFLGIVWVVIRSKWIISIIFPQVCFIMRSVNICKSKALLTNCNWVVLSLPDNRGGTQVRFLLPTLQK